MKTVKIELQIPDTADMVLDSADYAKATAKIADSINEQLRSQFGGQDQTLTADFLREMFLAGAALETSGGVYKRLCVKYAERGRFLL